jgi:tetratricopeptide (TPR) repeat protein
LTARIERQPSDASLYLKRGDQYRYQGNWSDARADYRRARRIDPALDVVDLRLGALFLDRGEPRRAKKSLDAYLARRPRDLLGLRLRSRAFRQLGMPLAAAEDMRRGIDLCVPPHRPEPDDYLERARAFEAAGGDHLGEAILALDEGIAALGPIVSLQLPAIELDVQVGRFEDALRRVDVLEGGSGRREVWLVKRAEILERAGRHDEARTVRAQLGPIGAP